ncbi:glycosyltransferase family 2 protein [Actinomyces sp.]|uniref:glycosyltransferase family 2 protein n=1 Tax=Actinomyces sp. TaxID=29317 RepID=UPI0026DAD02F|nr:glycosyltransferase family 2 protein [Actinomyces sp.]MDO4899380.1 glycosyltransferase family 2 protein [Actinomyces sp.]
MTASPEPGAGNAVVAVVVTYHPTSGCEGLLEVLAAQCARVVVVDNGSTETELLRLRAQCDRTGAVLIETGHNAGIARAQNRGISEARALGARWVLLSDDDSAPTPGMVSRLVNAAETAGRTRRVAAIGPLVRENNGADDLVYVPRRWGPRRASPTELDTPLLSVAFLIASGCLIDLRALDDIGGMNEDLFIDHVDLEWGLRAHSRGYELLVATAARMDHSLGDQVIEIPGRRQPVHVHAPVRNYYMVRNTLWLVGSGLLPPLWRVGYLWWLAKYSGFNVLVNAPRRERLAAVLQGVADAVHRRYGMRH